MAFADGGERYQALTVTGYLPTLRRGLSSAALTRGRPPRLQRADATPAPAIITPGSPHRPQAPQRPICPPATGQNQAMRPAP